MSDLYNTIKLANEVPALKQRIAELEHSIELWRLAGQNWERQRGELEAALADARDEIRQHDLWREEAERQIAERTKERDAERAVRETAEKEAHQHAEREAELYQERDRLLDTVHAIAVKGLGLPDPGKEHAPLGRAMRALPGGGGGGASVSERKIFLICTVRDISSGMRDFQDEYVRALESAGDTVHYPIRDTDQEASGINICRQNLQAIREADEVHVFYSPSSQGTHFDMGMAFALGKKIVVASTAPCGEGKSFARMLMEWESCV